MMVLNATTSPVSSIQIMPEMEVSQDFGSPAGGRRAVQCEIAAEVLRLSGGLALRVLGDSMLPAVWPGDTVTIRLASISDIHPGDLALVSRNGGFVLHRVLENRADKLITRGDSLSGDDPDVLPSQVLGKATAIQRGRARLTPKGELSRIQTLLRFAILRFHWFRLAVLRLHALRLKVRGLAAKWKPALV